jgi:hypothetical protein
MSHNKKSEFSPQYQRYHKKASHQNQAAGFTPSHFNAEIIKPNKLLETLNQELDYDRLIMMTYMTTFCDKTAT